MEDFYANRRFSVIRPAGIRSGIGCTVSYLQSIPSQHQGFIKLLINALIGAVILFIFNFVFAGLLNISALAIPITWWSALVTGIFGVPGVIVLLIISLIL